MRQKKNISGRKNERGIIIVLVAVVMLGVVGAMAALSIDVVTIYTTRSEAQLAADAAALAGARTLANSGMTSDPTNALLTSNAENRASRVAVQVARSNSVGGRPLAAGEVTVTFPNAGSTNFGTNPHVTVAVQETNVPTFFARIWGSKQVTVGASATAEAYNPSGASGVANPSPVAPVCVKPWLLPNLDPSTGGTTTIFTPATGAITNTGLLGWTTPGPPTIRLKLACGAPGTTNPVDCVAPLPAAAWEYYPGAPASFPPPTQALPSCAPPLTTPYEESIAGCIQTPIACNSQVSIETPPYGTRQSETADAVNCLTHAATGGGDQVEPAAVPSPPFQYLAGVDNPIAGLAGSDTMVSDSLVTVPVIDVGAGPFSVPPNPVTIMGFVQLFLSPQGTVTPITGDMKTTVINMAGCGAGFTGTPILGNGASPVAVRLITAP